MSDDLVKRLRDTPNWMREGFQDWKDNVRTYDRAPFEAADRIEKLEAKLEKAVEALEECVEEIDAYIQHQYPHDHPVQERHRQRDYASNPARLAIEELAGGKDE